MQQEMHQETKLESKYFQICIFQNNKNASEMNVFDENKNASTA